MECSPSKGRGGIFIRRGELQWRRRARSCLGVQQWFFPRTQQSTFQSVRRAFGIECSGCGDCNIGSDITCTPNWASSEFRWQSTNPSFAATGGLTRGKIQPLYPGDKDRDFISLLCNSYVNITVGAVNCIQGWWSARRFRGVFPQKIARRT